MNFKISDILPSSFRALSLCAAVATILTIPAGCRPHHAGDNKQLKADADSFAISYFNWQFEKAAGYCTADSRIWLRYAASNVRESDIDILKNKSDGASYKIEKIHFPSDSIAHILVTVKDFVGMDTLGKKARIIPEARFRLSMVFENNRWKVRMEGLPRSEKQNHD